MSAILSIKNLSINYQASFGIVEAVKNISFDVQAGKILSIVGQSGSGKSTIVSAIMDLTKIDGGKIVSGEIFYEGKDLLKMSFEEKRLLKGKVISMIFQDPSSYLNPVVKVGKQISESFTVHNPKVSKDNVINKVQHSLKKVGLDDFKRIYNSYPHQLSGGQKQRILIAMAIINNPKILIADEPTTGLDADIQKQILDLIRDLKNDLGLTLIMITHNMKIAKEYSDEIIQLSLI